MIVRKLDDHTMVCSQIEPEEVAELAGHGVTVLVNNRPDGEDQNQPLAAEIEAAATAAGIAYRFAPVRYGIGPTEIEHMREAMRSVGEGKLCAFCRSGTRLRADLGTGEARRGEFGGRGHAAGRRGRLRPLADCAPALVTTERRLPPRFHPRAADGQASRSDAGSGRTA